MPQSRSALVPAMFAVVRTAAAVVLLVAVLAVGAGMLVPKLAGWAPMVVTSGSMEPTFSAGDVVVVEPVDPTTLREDDVVSFRDSTGGVTTHRVASVLADGGRTVLVTRGDANEDSDPQRVELTDVVGRAHTVVPRLGLLTGLLSGPAGIAGAAVLLVLVLVPGPRRPGGEGGEATGTPSADDAEATPRLSVVR